MTGMAIIRKVMLMILPGLQPSRTVCFAAAAGATFPIAAGWLAVSAASRLFVAATSVSGSSFSQVSSELKRNLRHEAGDASAEQTRRCCMNKR